MQTQSTPHRCPICEGSGMYVQGGVTSAIPCRETHPCHGCNGTGIVWSMDVRQTSIEITLDDGPPAGELDFPRWRF